MPEDKMYIPVQVGSEGKADLGYQKDNEGENISEKNPYFCELTGLYWAWKNLNADYVGLVHYRRYFSLNKKIPKDENEKFKILLTEEQASKKLEKVDVILPKLRKYYIENNNDSPSSGERTGKSPNHQCFGTDGVVGLRYRKIYREWKCLENHPIDSERLVHKAI